MEPAIQSTWVDVEPAKKTPWMFTTHPYHLPTCKESAHSSMVVGARELFGLDFKDNWYAGYEIYG